MTNKDRKPNESALNVAKKPMIALYWFGNQLTWVGDPDVVQDIYGKHSKNIDKSSFTREFFSPMARDVFAMMEATD